MKKTAKILLGLSILVTASFGKAFAFQSQTHWKIAEKTLSLCSLKFDSEQEKIYKSGTFLADIGRLAWDRKFTHSDSKDFAEKLSKTCDKTNLEEVLFAMGWNHHTAQDLTGSVIGGIFGSGNYTIRCSQLENHFKNSGDKMIFSGGESFYINCDLIRKTYTDLHGFPPTDENIFSELNKLIIGVTIISRLPQATADLTESENQNLNAQISNLAELCAKDLENVDKSNAPKEKHTLLKNPELIELTFNGTDLISEKLKEFGKISRFEKIGTYKNFDEIVYRIDDKNKYDSLILETTSLALSLIK